MTEISPLRLAVWELNPHITHSFYTNALKSLNQAANDLLDLPAMEAGALKTIIDVLNAEKAESSRYTKWFIIIGALRFSTSYRNTVFGMTESANETRWMERACAFSHTAIVDFMCKHDQSGQSAQSPSNLRFFNLHHFVFEVINHWQQL